MFGIRKKLKLRREEQTEKELFRLMSDQEWWFVLDLYETGDFGWLGAGNIYPMLYRFEAQGIIESSWNEDVAPRRRQYRMKSQRLYETNRF